MLYLASQSPRRRELLNQLGVSFEVLNVQVPEQRQVGESPHDYVSRVARDKALAGLNAVGGHARVLGADTEVVLDNDVFGKPADAAAAVGMLQRLSGRTHQVISVIWLVEQGGEQFASCVSQVRFAELGQAAIARYVATGECFGKAGGYAIQGRGAALIAHLQGSYSGVMGLPLFETAALLNV